MVHDSVVLAILKELCQDLTEMTSIDAFLAKETGSLRRPHKSQQAMWSGNSFD